ELRGLLVPPELLARDAGAVDGERRARILCGRLREDLERRRVLLLPRERVAERDRGRRLCAQREGAAERALGLLGLARVEERLPARGERRRAPRIERRRALELLRRVGGLVLLEARAAERHPRREVVARAERRRELVHRAREIALVELDLPERGERARAVGP